MKKCGVIALLIPLLSVAVPAFSQVGVGSEDTAHYIARTYGSGNDIAQAATVYVATLSRLWAEMEEKPHYDQNLTILTDEAQLCLQAKLDRVASGRSDQLITELKRKLAGNPQKFAGFLVATQLSQQHPIRMSLSEQQACTLVGVEAPTAAE